MLTAMNNFFFSPGVAPVSCVLAHCGGVGACLSFGLGVGYLLVEAILRLCSGGYGSWREPLPHLKSQSVV